MSEYSGGAKIFLSGLVLIIAILMNQLTITRIQAPIVVYQIQLFSQIMYFCPGNRSPDIDCGRWLRKTAYGSTVFAQPGETQFGIIED